MVFVDTGGWIAMAVKRDRFHKKAASYYRKLSKQNIPLATSNYVLSETLTRIRYDDGHAKALQFTHPGSYQGEKASPGMGHSGNPSESMENLRGL